MTRCIRARRAALAGTLIWILTSAPGCAQTPVLPAPGGFPAVRRPVASVVSPTWDTEDARDRNREADIGAGTGYYTVRLARRLGPASAIYAQDIDPGYLAGLDTRLRRERLDWVRTVFGAPEDPKLPPASVDVALLGHMYHEIGSPYQFMYTLRGALGPGGRVAIVDVDRPTASHGTPPALLRCELAALGYRELEFHLLTPAPGYLAVFAPPDDLPDPAAITPCDAG